MFYKSATNKNYFQTQQCVCGTDLCNKDFETAAPPPAGHHNNIDGDDSAPTHSTSPSVGFDDYTVNQKDVF